MRGRGVYKRLTHLQYRPDPDGSDVGHEHRHGIQGDPFEVRIDHLDAGWRSIPHFDVGAGPAAHPDGQRAYVSHMSGDKIQIIDLRRQKIAGSLTLPNQDTGLPGRLQGRFMPKRTANAAASLVVSPGGHRLHVAHVMVNTGVHRSASLGRGGYGMGAPSPIEATVATFDLDKGELMRPPVKFEGRGDGMASTADAHAQTMAQPVAVIHDPRSARLFMVGHGCDRVMEMDAAKSDPITHPNGIWMVGQAPKGIAVSRDGSRAFVHNSQSHDVSVLDLDRKAGAVHQRFALTPKARLAAFSKSPLPASAQRGQRLFTFALDHRVGGANKFACASCHPDGRHDGLVWHIGAGPRQTPILAGRMTGTHPFNWVGSESELGDNITKTMGRLGGSGLPANDVADLQKFIESYLPGMDNPSRGNADRELVALGKELFHSSETGCSGCHDSRNQYTDNMTHEVGTTTKLEADLWKRFGQKNQPGGPPSQSPPAQPQQMQKRIMLDRSGPVGIGMRGEPIPEAPVAYKTPSLRHIWASAPYYHDGSQQTLKDLITSGNKHDLMGKTSHLNGRQVDALAAYLNTL